MLRLGIQGHELLTTGNIELPMNENYQFFLKSVRRGEWAFEDVLDEARAYEAELLKLRDSPELRPEPNRALVQEWMIETYFAYWGA